MDTLRESVVGSAVRYVTHNRVFGYIEDQPDFIWPRPDDDATRVNSPEVSRPASIKQVRSSSQSTTGTLIDGASDPTRGKKPAPLSDEALRREEDFEGLYRPGDERHVEHDPTTADEVSWYGPSDPLNPKNYSTSKKLLMTAMLGLFYIASAIYTPGLLLLEEEFGANTTKATLGLTLFVLGYGISPMVLTPMTMIPQIGRRNVYLLTFVLYIGLLAGSAGVRNLPGFLVFRFLSGLAGSPAISTVGVSLADLFDGVGIPRAIAVWGSSASLGPILGPLIGAAAIARYNTWRAPLWILVCVSSVTLSLMLVFLPETSATKILYDRKKRVAKRTGRKVQTEWEQSGMNITVLGTVRDAIKISIDPTVAYIDFQIALAYMILYSWFESFPVVYGQGGYGFSPVIQGLIYLFIGGGVVVTVCFYLLWLRVSLEPKAKRNNGMLKPSDFLPPGFVGVVCMPICPNRTHWIVPSLFSVLFGPGIFLAFMSSLNYLGAGYYQHLVSIYALNALFRSVFAAFGPLYSNPALRGIGVDWYSTILAICSLAMIPLPILLHHKGDTIRARSKWAAQPHTEPAPDEKTAKAGDA